MGENYLDMATVIVIFFALGILLSRLGGVGGIIGGIIVRIKRMVCKLMGHRDWENRYKPEFVRRRIISGFK